MRHRYLFGEGAAARDSWVGAGIGSVVSGLGPIAIRAFAGPTRESLGGGDLATWSAAHKIRAHIVKWAELYGLGAGLAIGGALTAFSRTRKVGMSTLLFSGVAGVPGVIAKFALPPRGLFRPNEAEAANFLGRFGRLGVITAERLTGAPVQILGSGSRLGVYRAEELRGARGGLGNGAGGRVKIMGSSFGATSLSATRG